MTLMNGRGAFSVSDTGLLGYSADPARAVATLTWMDRAGNPIEPVGEPDSYFDVALSPDDRRVAVSSWAPDGNVDISVIDLLRRGNKRRLTSDEGFDYHPDWSRDGTRISFTSNRNGGPYQVFQRPSDGSGSDVGLVEHGGGSAQSVWGPKDSLVLFTSARDLWTQPVENAQKPSVVMQTAFSESGPVFSPDGRWIAYNSGGTGRLEVYIRPFPSKHPEHKVSINGGKMPRWRTDNEIFFVALDGNLMSARFDAAANPPTTIPEVRFGTPLANRPVWNRPYDVARNGQRFLIPVPRDPQEERLITVVTNWTAKLPR
jgi:Tol biopolymer transport system component